jgi:hypothetical protein
MFRLRIQYRPLKSLPLDANIAHLVDRRSSQLP